MLNQQRYGERPTIDYHHPVDSLLSLGFKSTKWRLDGRSIFPILLFFAAVGFFLGVIPSSMVNGQVVTASETKVSSASGKSFSIYIYGPAPRESQAPAQRKWGKWDIGNGLDAATVSILLVGFLIGLWQRDREEKAKAFEFAFQRKSQSNEALIRDGGLHKYSSAATDISIDGVKQRYEDVMYVYREIDNLEFVFEHYRDALIRPKAALRAVSIFRSRCDNTEFSALVRELCPKGEYRPDFMKAVDKIMSAVRIVTVPAPSPPTGQPASGQTTPTADAVEGPSAK